MSTNRWIYPSPYIGEKHWASKLSDAQVMDIYRSKKKIKAITLARKYNIAECSVSRIWNGGHRLTKDLAISNISLSTIQKTKEKK